MNAVSLAVLTAILGVDVGWQPLEGGGFQYIIQIEPQLLDTLRGGQDIVSDLPPELRGVRSYRVTIGNGRLPRIGNRPPTPADNAAAAPVAAPVATDPAAEPAADTLPNVAPLPADPTAAAGPTIAPNSLLQPPATFAAPENARDLDRAAPANHQADTTAAPPLPAEQPEQPEPSQQPERPLEIAKEFQLAIVAAKLPAGAEEGPELGPMPDAPNAAVADIPPASPPEASAAKPWGWLTLAVLGLFISLGFNFFLGWVTWGFRQRYAALASKPGSPRPQTA